MKTSDVPFVDVWRGLAKTYDMLGDTASGFAGCACGKHEMDGHKVANTLWAFSAFLKHKADCEEKHRKATGSATVTTAADGDAADKLRAAREGIE